MSLLHNKKKNTFFVAQVVFSSASSIFNTQCVPKFSFFWCVTKVEMEFGLWKEFSFITNIRIMIIIIVMTLAEWTRMHKWRFLCIIFSVFSNGKKIPIFEWPFHVSFCRCQFYELYDILAIGTKQLFRESFKKNGKYFCPNSNLNERRPRRNGIIFFFVLNEIFVNVYCTCYERWCLAYVRRIDYNKCQEKNELIVLKIIGIQHIDCILTFYCVISDEVSVRRIISQKIHSTNTYGFEILNCRIVQI